MSVEESPGAPEVNGMDDNGSPQAPGAETAEQQPIEKAATSANDHNLLDEAREDALDFLEGLLDAMELDGDVAGEITPEGEVVLSVEGSDGGFLIGRKGRTLEALQELLRAAVQRSAQGRVRLSLDIEGYRVRRREAVEHKANEAIERVLAEGGEIELEPMTAFERKLVHDLVAGREGVSSFSEGQDPRRRVVIQSDD